MSNALMLLTVADSLLSRLTTVNATLKQAQAEGRDVTAAEYAAAVAADDLARTKLEAAIAKAKAEGR